MAGVASLMAIASDLMGWNILDFLPSADDVMKFIKGGPEAKVTGSTEALPATDCASTTVSPKTASETGHTMMASAPSDSNKQCVPNLDDVKITGPSTEVMDIIQNAANLVGVDVSLLLAISHQESHFKTGAAASTSSAQGLFQLTSGTWKELVSKFGSSFGIGPSDIKDPAKNAILGACYIKALINDLGKKLGKQPSVTDIYTGFFLGSNGARKLLDSLKSNAEAIAADILPNAAKANHNIFYNDKGEPRTVGQVYATLYGKVGAQYLKFAKTTNNKTTMAAVDTTVNIPSLSGGGTSNSAPAGTTVALNTSGPTLSGDGAANSKPVAVAFNAPPSVDSAPDTRSTSTSNSGSTSGSSLTSAPKKAESPTGYHKTPNGQLIVMTG